MKLRAIRLENVRRFTEPVEIAGIDAGLNVLCLPNEQGKSTVFDALHAVFLKDRKCWDREVRSLAPHAGGDPAVSVEIELSAAVFRIEKRWSASRRGEARVYAAGRLCKQADDAEAWLAAALTAPRDGGPAGLLWVRQGQAGLDDGKAGRAARRGLMSSVAGEVEALTGGRRMDLAVERCREELARYLTATGRPRTDGPLKRAEDERAALAARRGELAEKAAALRDALERRRALHRELAVLEDGAAEAARRDRLAEAERSHLEASRQVEALERARDAERARRVEAAQAEERLAALDAGLAETAAAGAARERALAAAGEAAAGRGEAEVAMDAAAGARDTARRRAEAAAGLLRRALQKQAAAASAERRRELSGRLATAAGLEASIDEARAEAGCGLAASALAGLEALAAEASLLRRARDTGSVALTMDYADGRTAGVFLDGVALPGGTRVGIPEGARLEIEGVGRLTVHGGEADAGRAAEAALAGALAEAGFPSLEAARASAGRRAAAEARRREAEVTLRAVAPEGLDGLRAAIAALPEPAGDGTCPDLGAAERAEGLARNALDETSAELDGRRGAANLAQAAAAAAAAALAAAEERVERAAAPLAGIGDAEAERARRVLELAELRRLLAEAAGRREAIEAIAPDLAASLAALRRAQAAVVGAAEDRQRIRIELGKLDTAIGMQSAEAVEEELADVEVRLEAALQAARAAARDRYVEPVLSELRPLLRLLWPEAELRFDAEAVLPTALVRSGSEEDLEILSGGTREQVGLLVRLAFARLLAKGGVAAPVILDDAIVYTDDERIERMFEALTQQARDLQILVFTCRQKAFRALGGRSLAIMPVGRALRAAE